MSLPVSIALLLLLDAALFASIQPILGKLLLPIFGGTPLVWNSTLLFFQAVFFLGAGYAALKQHVLSPRKQLFSHLFLLVLSLLFLPIHIDNDAWYMAITSPYLRLVCALLFAVGMPIFMVSCNSVLLQTWCARSDLSYRKNPYMLFSVSHAGMILGFIVSTIVEPKMGLGARTMAWSIGFGIFSVAMIWVLLRLRAHLPDTVEKVKHNTSEESSDKIWWFLYPMTTGALLLCYTQVVSVDLSSFPQLWIMPLIFYSLSFVLTFANRTFAWLNPSKLLAVQLFFLIPAFMLGFSGETAGNIATLIIHSGLFIVSTLLLHGLLASKRPSGMHLPQFYIFVGLGNVVGAFLIAIVAPLILRGSIEYGLIMVGLCLLRPVWSAATMYHRGAWFVACAGSVCALLVALSMTLPYSTMTVTLTISLLAVGLHFLRHKPVQLAVLALGIIFARELNPTGVDVLFRDRSFFGPSSVGESETFRYYTNGNTLHGMQCMEGDAETQPNTYFHKEGPFGHFMQIFQKVSAAPPIMSLGLGVGTIASWGQPKQEVDFIEIDPLVQRIAEKYFTYLEKSPAKVKVLLGDGRAVMNDMPNKHYGLIVMDAFSSDVVPTHLVTLEAMQTYVKKLSHGGAIMINGSSRYYNLQPLLAGLAKELKMTLLQGNDYTINGDREGEMLYVSNWFALTNNEDLIKAVKEDPLWKEVNIKKVKDAVVWTDDFSSQFDLISMDPDGHAEAE